MQGYSDAQVEGLGNEDQILIRRTNDPSSYGNPYNPESLMVGSEDEQGLTPYDHRHWPSLAIYRDAIAGRLTPEEIIKIAPRVRGNRQVTIGPWRVSVSQAITEETVQ